MQEDPGRPFAHDALGIVLEGRDQIDPAIESFRQAVRLQPGNKEFVAHLADALDAKGTLHRLGKAEMGFTYRHCAVPEDWIFVSGAFDGRADDPKAIHTRIQEIQSKREESQPIRARTGGSTFTNPTGHKAWQLIDDAGCRGLRKGGAMVSEKHCNFLINTGDASAADIEALG